MFDRGLARGLAPSLATMLAGIAALCVQSACSAPSWLTTGSKTGSNTDDKCGCQCLRKCSSCDGSFRRSGCKCPMLWPLLVRLLVEVVCSKPGCTNGFNNPARYAFVLARQLSAWACLGFSQLET
ncbi:hypothetical protein GE09DRAFT_1144173 [Coniochaeta sp. 2T2.1]|nr:hypothetical protein GE09DRAFT_1144173 [Coniochaeta sp. 2T2.1]